MYFLYSINFLSSKKFSPKSCIPLDQFVDAVALKKETERNLERSLKVEAKLPTKHDGPNSTGRVQDALCPVDGQEIRLPRVTHPTVTLQEEVAALSVSVGVRGLVNDLQDGFPRNETVHSPRLIYLVRTVAVKELPYGQRPRAVGHGSVQDLHGDEDPPGVSGHVADGQT